MRQAYNMRKSRSHSQDRPSGRPLSAEDIAGIFNQFAMTSLMPALEELRRDICEEVSTELKAELRNLNLGKVPLPKPDNEPTRLAPNLPDWVKQDTRWDQRTKVPGTTVRLTMEDGALARLHTQGSGELDPDEAMPLVPNERPQGFGEFMDLDCEDGTVMSAARELQLGEAQGPCWPCSRNNARALIGSQSFDACVSFLVLTNALIIGLEADYSATHLNEPMPELYSTIDMTYFIFFALELSLRLFVHRSEFFFCNDWRWNLFDFTVVSLQGLEGLSKLFLSSVATSNLSFLRIMRMLRLLRIIRLGRLLHLIVELRSMVSSILGSFTSLCWALLLFIMLIYTVGVFFTQMVTERREELDSTDVEAAARLERYYGSLARTVLGLWACISGGTDWSNMLDPLVTELSVIVPLTFILYTAFCILAMMNVVTGIFVEKSQANAEADQAMCVVRNVIEVFEKAELNEDGEITWEIFQEKLNSPEVQSLFSSVNIDTADALGLFRLLDINDSGTVGPEEFLNGWVRLRGPAKSVDLAMLMRESERLAKFLHQKIDIIEEAIVNGDGPTWKRNANFEADSAGGSGSFNQSRENSEHSGRQTQIYNSYEPLPLGRPLKRYSMVETGLPGNALLHNPRHSASEVSHEEDAVVRARRRFSVAHASLDFAG